MTRLNRILAWLCLPLFFYACAMDDREEERNMRRSQKPPKYPEERA